MPILRIISPHSATLSRRDVLDEDTLRTAGDIITAVRTEGQPAILRLAQQFGDLPAAATPGPSSLLLLTKQHLAAACDRVGPATCSLLQRVASRITTFATAQRSALHNLQISVPGGVAGHRIAPVARAACYAPGGRYPLPSSVLMTALTARAAGVPEVYVLSPKPSDIVLAAASIAGADAILPIGGAHAIAAAAYGVGLPRCDVVVGPGNRFVTAAKKLLMGTIGIDMLAGPSEVLIIADDAANPRLIAADLLAQAEHDTDAAAIVLSTSPELLAQIEHELSTQLATLPTAPVAAAALAHNSFACLCDSMQQATDLAGELAPEHLEIHTRNPAAVAAQVSSYGAVFIGSSAAEVLGDYGIGPNHTLPTSGTSRFASGLSVNHFLRWRTFIQIDNPAAAEEVYRDSTALARLEGLEAHARSAECRTHQPALP